MQREARWQKNLQILYDSQQGGVFELMQVVLINWELGALSEVVDLGVD